VTGGVDIVYLLATGLAGSLPLVCVARGGGQRKMACKNRARSIMLH
jgi:hypothetical protein